MKKDDLKIARETLIKHGLLFRFSDLDLYHGRVKKQGEKEWSVDPNFDNAGNKTGNHNINKRAALSTGNFSVASEFADARLNEVQFRAAGKGLNPEDFSPEVYKIISSDEEAVIINRNFSFSSLTNEQKLEIQEALNVMRNFGVSELVPYPFEERKNHKVIVDTVRSYMTHTNKTLLKEKDIKNVCDKLKEKDPNISSNFVYEVVCAMNTKNILKVSGNIKDVSVLFLDSGSAGHKFMTNDGYPLSEAYYSAWLKNNHVVGLYRQVNSATLDWKRIDAFALFDLDKVNTQKAVGEKYQKLLDNYDEIAKLVDSFDLHKNMCAFLEKSTAEETMAKFRSKKNLDELFKADSGVWEGFTVGEHTETTLRIFENTYEEDVPKKLIPFVKLALVSHDMGKGMVEKEPNLNQKERNAKYAKILYDELKIPQEVQEMLQFAIGDSQRFTTDYFVRKNVKAIDELFNLTEQMLESALKRKPTEKEVDGFVNVCKIIQTCDSGAYTRYGITRKEGTNEYYYNGNDGFTLGFESPQGMSKRKLKMKEPGQE